MNFLELETNYGRMRFLLDSGASISVLKERCVNQTLRMNRSLRIDGIGGSMYANKSVNIDLKVEDLCLKHNFVVLNDFSSEFDGIIGSDFFTRYSAVIDFGKLIFSFNAGQRKFILPLQTNESVATIIPPRCEVIKYFKVNATNDCVIESQELCENLFIAGMIVKPREGVIPVKILNASDDYAKLTNYTPKIHDLTNFDYCNFDLTKITPTRVNSLLEELNLNYLKGQEKSTIESICKKYADIFHMNGDKLSFTNICQQTIEVKPNVAPVYVKPYRLPYSQKEEIHRQVDAMLKDDIIEETVSEWSSPLLLVPKKSDADGKKLWRVVIDYRLLNKQINDDKFPLPSITEIHDSLSDAIYFSHLDLSQGYYQVELKPESRACTSFSTDRGQYRMKRLPMGLKISPSAFSRVMTLAMTGLNYEKCLIYLDDLIVFGRNLENHNKNLIKVFERLRKVNLKLNPRKCEFLKKELLYLGHVISSEGIKPDPRKTEALRNYPVPTNKDETKRFVAFANYYRKYIKNFAQIAAPLNKLSRKHVDFIWSEDCQNSFDTLRSALLSPPVLQYPNFAKDNVFSLRTDASGLAIGAVLSNADDRPVAYASRTLNAAERNYPVIEKELLAIVWSINYFRPYVFGRKFTVYTDHRPLVYLFSLKNPNSRLTKFRLLLEEYDFTIVYVKGSSNVTADALSRIEIHSNDLKSLANHVNFANVYVTTRAQQRLQDQSSLSDATNTKSEEDPKILEILKAPKDSIQLLVVERIEKEKVKGIDLISNDRDRILFIPSQKIVLFKQFTRSDIAPDAHLRVLFDLCSKMNIKELIMMKDEKSTEFLKSLRQLSITNKDILKTGPRICIVNAVRKITDNETKKLILNDFHILPTSGHAGINRTYNNIKKFYFWPGLKTDVEKFIKTCDSCQRHKHVKPVRQDLTITSTATSAFHKIYLDIVGPLEKDQYGKTYILTLQCELSKFVEAYPIEDKESETVARTFVNNFILRYGTPREIATDRGTEFISNIVRDTCKILGVTQMTSTAYHHESIGALENAHKTLGSYLRIQCQNNPTNWSSWVPFWSFCYNTTVHSGTNFTPFELVFGKSCTLPSNLQNSVDPLYNFENYPLELKYRLQKAHVEARETILKQKYTRNEKLNINSRNVTYKAGDKLLIKNETGNKLQPIFNGPFVVVREENPNVIIIKKNKEYIIHKNRTRHYYD